MTNGWIDMKNTDMMLIMGGNPAENHPCGFKWPLEAKKTRNAKMIVIDPRFTRTAAVADLFVQIRAGTDIACLGGLINYAIQNNRSAKDYLVNYTNASFIVKEGFKLPEDGLFSGFDGQGNYDKSSWNYEEGGNVGPKAETTTAAAVTTPGKSATSSATAQPAPAKPSTPATSGQAAGPAVAAAPAAPKPPPTLPPDLAYDLSLQKPRAAFHLLKNQYSPSTATPANPIPAIPEHQS